MPILLLLAAEAAGSPLTNTVEVQAATGAAVGDTVAILRDGELTIVEEGPSWRSYQWAVDVEFYVYTETPDALGPAVNAAYGQCARLIQQVPPLGGLVERLVERDFLLEIDRTPNTGPTCEGTLGMFLFWDQPRGTIASRTVLREALATLLASNAPGDDRTLRERVLSGVRDRAAAATGLPVARNAARPVDMDALEAGALDVGVVLVDGEHDATSETDRDVTQYQLRFTVEIYSGETDPALRDVRLDAVETAIRGTLIDCPILDGVPVWIDEDTSDVAIDGTQATAPTAARLFRGFVTFYQEIPAFAA